MGHKLDSLNLVTDRNTSISLVERSFLSFKMTKCSGFNRVFSLILPLHYLKQFLEDIENYEFNRIFLKFCKTNSVLYKGHCFVNATLSRLHSSYLINLLIQCLLLKQLLPFAYYKSDHHISLLFSFVLSVLNSSSFVQFKKGHEYPTGSFLSRSAFNFTF